jgi:multidrug efflux pump
MWWKQLATAVVFGLGVATFLTLLLTPALLALRIWIEKGAYRGALGLRRLLSARGSALREDRKIERQLGTFKGVEVLWDEADIATADQPTAPVQPDLTTVPLRAAE